MYKDFKVAKWEGVCVWQRFNCPWNRCFSSRGTRSYLQRVTSSRISQSPGSQFWPMRLRGCWTGSFLVMPLEGHKHPPSFLSPYIITKAMRPRGPLTPGREELLTRAGQPSLRCHFCLTLLSQWLSTSLPLRSFNIAPHAVLTLNHKLFLLLLHN